MPTNDATPTRRPVSRTADFIARKWHPVVVHRLLRNGPSGFNDLREDIGDISAKVLSETLADLQSRGVVDRTIINEQPFRVHYALTPKGRTLEPVIRAMCEFGEDYLARPPQSTSAGDEHSLA